MKLDLHCHSTCSDGVLGPYELIQRAQKDGVDYLAITDHDSLNAMDEAHSVPGTVYIPGVELSVRSQLTGAKFHLLGLFPHAEEAKLSALRDFLAAKRQYRVDRIRKMVALLNQHFGLGINFEDFCSFAKINLATNTSEQTVGRPHVADYLVHQGIVSSRAEAFYRFLSDYSPAYVDSPAYRLLDAIHDIKNAGGFSFIAHCMLFENDRLEEDVSEAFKHGMDGLELYHYANEASYERVKKMARIYTLGSDWHDRSSKWELGCPVGNYLMSEDEKQRLLDYLGLP